LSTVPTIPSKQTITSHLKSYYDGNQGPGYG